MKTKHTVGLITGLILVSILTGIVNSQRTQEIRAYYYSHKDDIFYAQSVSTHEQTILAEYYTDPDSNSRVTGSGWSPTGNWFAWHDIYGQNGMNLLSYDGINKIIKENCKTFRSEWSPVLDRILFTCLDVNNNNFIYYIYDAQGDNIVFQMVENQLNVHGDEGIFRTYAEWLPSGNGIAIYFPIAENNINNAIYVMKVYDNSSNLVFETQFKTADILSKRPSLSSDDDVLYNDPVNDSLVFENIFDVDSYLNFDEINSHSHIEWSPDNEFVMIYVKNNEDVEFENYTIWLIDITQETAEILEKHGYMTPILTSQEIEPPQNSFSENNRYIIIYVKNNVFIFDINNNYSESLVAFRQWASHVWFEDVVYLVTENSDSDYSLYQYNTNDKSLVEITSYNYVYAPSLSISFDGRYIAIGSEDCGGICVFDIDNNQLLALPFIDYMGQEAVPLNINWNTSSYWLIASHFSTMGTWFFNLSNPDLDLSEYFGDDPLGIGCTLSPACIGWLPNNVTNVGR